MDTREIVKFFKYDACALYMLKKWNKNVTLKNDSFCKEPYWVLIDTQSHEERTYPLGKLYVSAISRLEVFINHYNDEEAREDLNILYDEYKIQKKIRLKT